MCAHTQLLEKTTKQGMLIGQMGPFFCVHALASISISTEDHSCESSLVSSLNTHTHLQNSFWQSGSFTNMKVCSSAQISDTVVQFAGLSLDALQCRVFGFCK